ncbi:MAG: rubrerythrin-like domain-containing protein [Halobacteriaceae archaeon]
MSLDAPPDVDAEKTYECLDCGTRIRATTQPQACPDCGATPRNTATPME